MPAHNANAAGSTHPAPHSAIPDGSPQGGERFLATDPHRHGHTAGAFGIAFFHLGQCIMSAFVEEGVPSLKEAATIGEAAAAIADEMIPTSPIPETQTLAQRCLAGLARKWGSQATGN